MPTPNSATRNSAHPLWWPSTCAAWENSWGAKLMVQEGVMREPRPDAVFGLHLWAGVPAGQIAYRPGPTLASSDDLRIRVVGRQTHAGRPWDGVDPIVVSAQALLGLQTVVSRQTDISRTPTVVSIGTIKGGGNDTKKNHTRGGRGGGM